MNVSWVRYTVLHGTCPDLIFREVYYLFVISKYVFVGLPLGIHDHSIRKVGSREEIRVWCSVKPCRKRFDVWGENSTESSGEKENEGKSKSISVTVWKLQTWNYNAAHSRTFSMRAHIDRDSDCEKSDPLSGRLLEGGEATGSFFLFHLPLGIREDLKINF